MKILLATDVYLPTINGVVTSTVSLKKSLEKLGHDIKVLTLAKDSYIDLEQNVYAISSLNFNMIYPGARLRLFKDRSTLEAMINWHPDLIHTQSEFSTFRMAKCIANYLDIPIIHTYHTVYEDYTHYFSPNKRTGKKIVSVLTKKVLSETEEIIAPTKKVYDMLDEYGVEPHVTTIPTGIQLAAYQQWYSEAERLELRRKYQIPADIFLLLSLGRLGKEKNIEEMIHYLSLIDENIYFLIVGDGPNRDNLQQLAQDLGVSDRVIFTGMVEPQNVPLFYQSADLFVSASTSETQGLTYIEALASGIPALCRRDESIKNVIINDQTGYQFESFTEFEYYLNIFISQPDKYQYMAKTAQQFAWNHFSSETFGQNVHEVYQRALESYHSKQIVNMNH